MAASRPAHTSPTFLRRASVFFYNHPRLALIALLSLPLIWLGAVYVGSLAALLTQSFYSLDGFTGLVVREFTLNTYRDLFTAAHIEIIIRTTAMAAVVTVIAAFMAFPLAYYMARYANPRMKSLLNLAVLLPLWSSYLVRVYAWKLILADEGIISWFTTRLGLSGLLDALLSVPEIGGRSLSFSLIGTFLVFLYVWLPYMVLPIAAALERVPNSVVEASSDLGARPGYTFRTVIFPLAFPGVVAGSIFTFSLTLGDFIIPGTIGNSKLFLGQAVLQYQGTAGNIPLAAAFTMVPIVIMGIYLIVARRMGAFDAL